MITRGIKDLLAEANQAIVTHSVDEVKALRGEDNTRLVDIRDIRELQRDGVIPGAHHAPRGMLEFWVDPESPYYRDFFGDESAHYILFCAGGLRSALAAHTLTRMGMTNVAHMEGGFGAWKSAGGEIAPHEKKSRS